MIGFYMDEHVPEAVTHGRRDRGVDVLTVHEDGRDGPDDDALLDRATEMCRVVFTQDQDFFVVAAKRQGTGESFAGVFYVAQHKLSIRQMIEELELIARCCVWQEWAGMINNIPIG